MTYETLLGVALASIDDADARVVLADALEETGWWDERVSSEELGGWSRFVTHDALRVRQEGYSGRCHAIAAVLLCWSWPTSWPLAERCRRKPWTVERVGVGEYTVTLDRPISEFFRHASQRQSDPQR